MEIRKSVTGRRLTKTRDDRDYDTTQLKEDAGMRVLSRDYTAHFFRWCFAKRLIKKTDDVLEVGCGEEKPLSKLLIVGLEPHCNTYTGVDLNPLKPSKIARLDFRGEFNFVEHASELIPPKGLRKSAGYDVLVHLEVIEHMRVDLGAKFLKNCLKVLRPGGRMIMSTPCYDGKRHAANHIHEYTVPELQSAVEKVGFKVAQRFGTFMDLKQIDKGTPALAADRLLPLPADLAASVKATANLLAAYYSRDALSNIMAPLYPDHARNNLWVCTKEK